MRFSGPLKQVEGGLWSSWGLVYIWFTCTARNKILWKPSLLRRGFSTLFLTLKTLRLESWKPNQSLNLGAHQILGVRTVPKFCLSLFLFLFFKLNLAISPLCASSLLLSILFLDILFSIFGGFCVEVCLHHLYRHNGQLKCVQIFSQSNPQVENLFSSTMRDKLKPVDKEKNK